MHFLQPCSTIFCQQIDIVFTKDGIYTLVNVVIIDPTWRDLLPWTCITQILVASDVAQAKERNYRDQHPTNQFLLLTIEVYGYLHR
jgi:hypothetical protein